MAMRTWRSRRRKVRSIEPLEARMVLSGGPLITEFMAVNRTTLQDEDGDFRDWIEIHNPSSESVRLDGWYLTDQADDLRKWQFPDVELGADAYLVVFASAKDRNDPAGELHTNFKLSANGEFLALVEADGTTIRQQFEPAFPPQTQDVSYGLAADLTTNVFFTNPTPGAANLDGTLGAVADPRVSVEHGFFDAPFDVEITTPTPGAELRFTLDGSRPTSTTGRIYNGPITVTRTTTLRVAAFKTDFSDSGVVTKTYLFPQDVLTQPADPAGFPSQWQLASGQTVSTAYDAIPEIVATHRDTLVDDLKAIPTLSLVLNVDDIFGPGGTYNTTANLDSATSVELINPDGSAGFQIDGAVRLAGASSRLPDVQKRNLRLLFSSDFGPSRLNFPFFDDSPIATYDTLVLRANVQDGWGRNGPGQRQQIKDEFARQTQIDLGRLGARGRFVHLYINGLYWGMYNATERPNSLFTAEHLGGTAADWDNLNAGRLRQGNSDAWDALLAILPAGGRALARLSQQEIEDRAAQLREMIDVPGFIDYVLVGMYLGTTDWLPNNYWAARRSRNGDGPVDPNDPAAKFRFIHWDQEQSLEDVNVFRTPGFSSPVGRIFNLLRKTSEFQEEHAQQVYRALFNGGALSPEKVVARYQNQIDEVKQAIRAEDVRWGVAPSSIPAWKAETRNIMRNFFPVRREKLLEKFRKLNLYPATDAPLFSQQGGLLSPGQTLDITAAEGVVYYTLDGSDPRLDDGTVSPTAILFTDPITLPHDAVVRARALAGGTWSVFNEAEFAVGTPAPVGAVVITELNYHPAAPTAEERVADGTLQADDFEFIEIHNTANEPVDLTGARFTAGIDFEFSAGDPADRVLAPGEYAVIVANAGAFADRYGSDGIRVLGEYTGRLDDGGERIRLEGAFGSVWHDFSYDNRGNWPQRADGLGSSLELVDARSTRPAEDGDSQSWAASVVPSGTPGSARVQPAGVVINEVLARSGADDVDAVELFNTTDHAIDVGGWYLSNSANDLLKYAIPAKTVVPPLEYLVIDGRDFSFNLDGRRGDVVWLVTTNAMGSVDTFVDRVTFGAATIGTSWGRWPNGTGRMTTMREPTFGRENSGPRLGDVVISELMLSPLGPNASGLQFVELFNTTGAAIDLSNWRIRQGVKVDLPAGTTIAPHAVLVVAPFDPTDQGDAGRLNLFRLTYDLDSSVQIVGGFSGNLKKEGEPIELQNADRDVVDGFAFDDRAPWPSDVGTAGGAIHRIDPNRWGGNGSNWVSGPPTPGSVAGAGPALPGDLDLNGGVDIDDAAAFALAIGDPEAYVQQFGVAGSAHGDIDQDGDVDFDDIQPFRLLIDAQSTAALARAQTRPAADWMAAVDEVLRLAGR